MSGALFLGLSVLAAFAWDMRFASWFWGIVAGLKIGMALTSKEKI
jgi:hypothetical protein